MANRFWVGGSATWDGTAGTKWATTSGGAGGAAVPLNTDAVFIDANSGAVTVTVAAGGQLCASIDTTGFTGTITGGTLEIDGNATFAATAADFSTLVTLLTGGTNSSLTTNGKSISSTTVTKNLGSTLTIQDDLTAGNITLSAGTLDFNNKNVSCNSFISTSGTRTLTPGSGTFTVRALSGTPWNVTSSLTITANTGTIKFTGSSASIKTLAFAGLTYNNVWLSGGGTGAVTITGSSTFNDLKIDTPPRQVNFTAGTTQFVTTFTASGTAGNLITLHSTSAGFVWTISAPSGTVNSDYLSIKDSTATGGATWNAGINSIDGGNNSGWIFSAQSPSNAPQSPESLVPKVLGLSAAIVATTFASFVPPAPPNPSTLPGPLVFSSFSLPTPSRAISAAQQPSVSFEVKQPAAVVVAPPVVQFSKFSEVGLTKFKQIGFGSFVFTPIVVIPPQVVVLDVFVKKRNKPDLIAEELRRKEQLRADLDLAIFGPLPEYTYKTEPEQPKKAEPQVGDLAALMTRLERENNIKTRAGEQDEDDLEQLLKDLL